MRSQRVPSSPAFISVEVLGVFWASVGSMVVASCTAEAACVVLHDSATVDFAPAIGLTAWRLVIAGNSHQPAAGGGRACWCFYGLSCVSHRDSFCLWVVFLHPQVYSDSSDRFHHLSEVPLSVKNTLGPLLYLSQSVGERCYSRTPAFAECST